MKPDRKAHGHQPQPVGPRSVAPAAGLALAGAEHGEPRVGAAFQTPIWLVVAFGLALYWATMYVDHNGGGFSPMVFNQGEMLADLDARVPRSEADALVTRGRVVYNTYCTACHQPNGRGLPGQFPPLAGSDWVQTDGPNRMIRIVLNGLQGPITVNGVEFNNAMLPWRDQLSDEDIAAVVTYVRGNKEWGNSSGPATPAQVKAIRAATEAHGTYWTAPELLAIPVKD
jgi:mono/diheme cytochrome c family protein